jgi:hypothetical protein
MISIANFCILVPTWSKDASIIADSVAAPEVQASNLLNIRPPYFFRSKQCECVRIIASVPYPTEWNAVYLGYTHSSTATIRVISDDTPMHLFGVPDFDSGPQQIRWDHFFLQASRIQEYKYIGIEIRDRDNPVGFFQAGVFQAGMMIEPEQPPLIDEGMASDDTYDTSIWTGFILRPKRRRLIFDLTFYADSDVYIVESMMRKHEGRTPMVFKWDRLWDDQRRQIAIYAFASWQRWPDIVRIQQL